MFGDAVDKHSYRLKILSKSLIFRAKNLPEKINLRISVLFEFSFLGIFCMRLFIIIFKHCGTLKNDF